MSSSSSRVSSSVAPWFIGVVVLQLAHLFAVSTSRPEHLAFIHDIAGWCSGLLAVAGTFAAASAFGSGDYLRRVWGGLTAGALLSLMSAAMRSYWLHTVPDVPFTASPLLPFRMVVVVLANVATTFALVLLARTYRQSGLQPPSSPRASALWAGTALAALAVGVPALVTEVRNLISGNSPTASTVISLASTLADMTIIFMVAPILRVAYMLRGGKLAWVWWAMGLSGATWLLYDARVWLAPLLPGGEALGAELLRSLRTSGLVLLGLAGWLQRSALGPQKAEASEPSLHTSAGTP